MCFGHVPGDSKRCWMRPVVFADNPRILSRMGMRVLAQQLPAK
jgi:hypothetical protein